MKLLPFQMNPSPRECREKNDFSAKIILVLILSGLVSCFNASAQIIIPQLQAGVPVNDTSNTFTYCFPGNCDTLGDVILQMDPALMPVVPGVEIHFFVSQLTTVQGSVYTLEGGILQINDTLRFSSSGNTRYSFYASTPGCMTLNALILGIPTAPNITYPCQVETFCTLANCFNTCLNIPDTPYQCVVFSSPGIIENANSPDISVIPDPAGKHIKIEFQKPVNQACDFILFSSDGRECLRKKIPENNPVFFINAENLKPAVYSWKIVGPKKSASGKLLVLSK